MTSGRCASATAVSMSWFAVTQTGQPGPESSVTLPGMTPRRPFLAIDTVWVPQTSMTLTSWSMVAAVVLMASIRPRAISGSRNAERSMGALCPFCDESLVFGEERQRLQQLERLVRGGLIDHLKCEARVHEHVVALDLPQGRGRATPCGSRP